MFRSPPPAENLGLTPPLPLVFLGKPLGFTLALAREDAWGAAGWKNEGKNGFFSRRKVSVTPEGGGTAVPGVCSMWGGSRQGNGAVAGGSQGPEVPSALVPAGSGWRWPDRRPGWETCGVLSWKELSH